MRVYVSERERERVCVCVWVCWCFNFLAILVRYCVDAFNIYFEQIMVYDFSNEKELIGYAFYDVGIYVVSISCVKNYVFVGDIYKSLYLLCFKVCYLLLPCTLEHPKKSNIYAHAASSFFFFCFFFWRDWRTVQWAIWFWRQNRNYSHLCSKIVETWRC